MKIEGQGQRQRHYTDSIITFSTVARIPLLILLVVPMLFDPRHNSSFWLPTGSFVLMMAQT
jgi:hypothetical protein